MLRAILSKRFIRSLMKTPRERFEDTVPADDPIGAVGAAAHAFQSRGVGIQVRLQASLLHENEEPADVPQRALPTQRRSR